MWKVSSGTTWSKGSQLSVTSSRVYLIRVRVGVGVAVGVRVGVRKRVGVRVRVGVTRRASSGLQGTTKASEPATVAVGGGYPWAAIRASA